MGGRILKILADTVLEFFGLADIDNRTGLILHDVDARLIWKRKRLVLEFFKRHSF